MFSQKVFLLLGVLPLLVLSGIFWENFRKPEPIVVTDPVRVAGEPGEALVLNIKGQGITEDTTAILTPRIDNNQAIVTTFPLPGIFNDAVLYRDYLYLGTVDKGLYAVDVSHPRQPRLLNTYLVNRPVANVLRINELLVAACGKQGLFFFKILDNGLLEYLNDFPAHQTVIKGSYAGGYLYVAAGRYGVLSLNISDLQHIDMVADGASEGFVTDLFTFGNLLVTGTTNPHQLKSYRLDPDGGFTKIAVQKLSGRIRSMVQKGPDLYVATTDGLSVYRLLPSGNFKRLMHRPELRSAEKLFSGNDGIYVFKNYSALNFLSIDTFTLSDNYFLSSKVRTLSELGDYLLVSGFKTGLTLIDKKALQPDNVARLYEMPVPVENLFFHRDKIYVMGEKGVFTLAQGKGQPDLQQISPVKTGFLIMFKGLLVAGHKETGIEIFDISTDQPAVVATWPKIKSLQLGVSGKFILSASGINGMSCIDADKISAPVVTDTLENIHILDFQVADQLIYLATKDNGLMIFSLSEQGQFQLLSQTSTPFPMSQFDYAVALEVVKGKAYIANGRSGLLIIDVGNPRNPEIVSSLGLPGESKGVLIRDDMAMVISGESGLRLIDVGNPEAPRVVGQMNIPRLLSRIQLSDDMFYLPRVQGNLLVLPAPRRATRVSVQSSKNARIEFRAPEVGGHFDLHLTNGAGMVTLEDAVVIRN